MAQLFAQHSVLFPKVIDQLQLLLVHPARQCDQQEPERGQGFRHEESNFITGSPAVQGLGRYPIAVYADRFSGHYGAGGESTFPIGRKPRLNSSTLHQLATRALCLNSLLQTRVGLSCRWDQEAMRLCLTLLSSAP